MIAARSARLTGAIGRLLTGYEPLRSPTRADGAAWRARRLPWQPRGTAGSEGLGAVIVGGGFLALGIARSLGRRGIPVCVIDDGPSITRASRYVTTTVRVPDLLEDEQAVSAVLDVGTRLGLQGWVLFPTRDETVAAFARHKARLEEVFRLPLPTYESVRWAWDKRATYELAERLGIPAPRTRSPVDADELAALDLEFPLVVKPAIKEHFFYATNVKAWRVEDYAELSARFAEAAALVPLGEVMVQELIAGDRLYAYGAFFKDGEALGTMVVRRWRQYPREFGRWSTYVETIDLPLLERQSEEFLRAIDYYGLVELEYKHDARDGRYKLLDVNARAWAYHSIGYAAGVDFPALLFADATGQPVEPLRARTGVTWVRLLADLPIVLSDMAHGRRGPRSLLDTVFRSDAEAVVSLSDPAPALAEVAVMPYRFARSVFRARRSSTATSQPTLSA